MHYKKESSDVLNEVGSNINGISDQEAKIRLEKNGFNELKEGNKVPIWKMFLENFKDPLVIILLIAAIVQIFLGEFVESLIIFVVVILNALLGVTQTRKAESSLDSLKKLSMISIFNFLLEHTVTVTDSTAVCRIIQCRKRIQETCCSPLFLCSGAGSCR